MRSAFHITSTVEILPKFSKLSIKLKNKILLGYGLSLALVILVGGWGVNNLRRLGQASEALLEENYNSILAAENTIEALERQDSAILLFLLENRNRGIQQFQNN